jgi:hypothetical protein
MNFWSCPTDGLKGINGVDDTEYTKIFLMSYDSTITEPNLPYSFKVQAPLNPQLAVIKCWDRTSTAEIIEGGTSISLLS